MVDTIKELLMPDNEIEEKLKQIHQLLAECTQIADKEGTMFSFRPAYSMGGTYYSPSIIKDWKMEDDYQLYNGWKSSSADC